MKNVNPRKVFDLSTQMSALTEKKFQDNDIDFFQRFEKFIEQENLSDQRFSVHDKYILTIPNDYVVLNNVENYENFRKNWNPAERNGVKMENSANFMYTSFDFAEQFVPGKKYVVTEYVINNHDISNEECFKFISDEKAGMYGLPGILTLLDLNKDKVTFKSKGVVSIDRSMMADVHGIYFAKRLADSLQIGHVRKHYLTQGDILITFKEKA